jgi:hypothetical protein
MRAFLANGGGRKFLLVAAALVVAAVNDILSLGIDKDTIGKMILGAVGGSGAIAVEDGIRAFANALSRKGADTLLAELHGLCAEDESEDTDETHSTD